MISNVATLASQLREHADRVAGDGPSGANYDPETLSLEHQAADELLRLEKKAYRILPGADEEDPEGTTWREEWGDEIFLREEAEHRLRQVLDLVCEGLQVIEGGNLKAGLAYFERLAIRRELE